MFIENCRRKVPPKLITEAVNFMYQNQGFSNGEISRKKIGQHLK
jgi:hypothetical protein